MNEEKQADSGQYLAERKPSLAALNALAVFFGGGLIGSLTAGWVAFTAGFAMRWAGLAGCHYWMTSDRKNT